MNESHYYTSSLDPNKYKTIWTGYIKYQNNFIDSINQTNEQMINNLRIEIDEIIQELTDINFYIDIQNNIIYLSVDDDEAFYYHQFEKSIKKIVRKIEEKYNNIFIESEFFATEYKHRGNQYKYNLIKESSGEKEKLILKKVSLNWSLFEKLNH